MIPRGSRRSRGLIDRWRLWTDWIASLSSAASENVKIKDISSSTLGDTIPMCMPLALVYLRVSPCREG